jgi:predicted aspartyl protease
MGHVIAKAKLYNPGDPSKNLEVELLIDTGSTYSWIKRDKLEELGLKPMTRWKFKTVEGKIVERDIGEVVVECLRERATTVTVFAENRDAEVLGVHAMEGLRLEVDPVTKQLKKVEALPALVSYNSSREDLKK